MRLSFIVRYRYLKDPAPYSLCPLQWEDIVHEGGRRSLFLHKNIIGPESRYCVEPLFQSPKKPDKTYFPWYSDMKLFTPVSIIGLVPTESKDFVESFFVQSLEIALNPSPPPHIPEDKKLYVSVRQFSLLQIFLFLFFIFLTWMGEGGR